MNLAQKLEERGRPNGVVLRYRLAYRQAYEEGVQQGREEAREAFRQTLSALIDARFGSPDDESAARIAGADLPTLQRWMVELLSARTLSDLFADRARPLSCGSRR